MITDKEKYGALLLFHLKDERERNPEFQVVRTLGISVYRVMAAEIFPTPTVEKQISKTWPAMAELLIRKSPRKIFLTPKGEKCFAALLASGNARLRPRGGAAEIKLTAPAVKISEAKVAVIGKGSSTSLMWGRLGQLVLRSPDAKTWLAVLETAAAQKTPLTDLVTTLKTLTQEA